MKNNSSEKVMVNCSPHLSDYSPSTLSAFKVQFVYKSAYISNLYAETDPKSKLSDQSGFGDVICYRSADGSGSGLRHLSSWHSLQLQSLFQTASLTSTHLTVSHLVFSSQLFGAGADKHLWLQSSHFMLEWFQILLNHTEDKKPDVSGFFIQCQRGNRVGVVSDFHIYSVMFCIKTSQRSPDILNIKHKLKISHQIWEENNLKLADGAFSLIYRVSTHTQTHWIDVIDHHYK